MPDHATSVDREVQVQLDRLWALSPGADVLGLERITQLLARLGNPERTLPPVFHVAGTNGKGSTCAFLRAALEASGHRVHIYSSPHLVRFNERIRVAGALIDDATLAGLLAEVLDHAGGIGASFFEVTTAAAFLYFARVPADACVIEVGLGGRLDATNVLPAPAACGIAALGIDHEAWLGDTIEAIAREKAGIAKRDSPLVTMRYASPVRDEIAIVAKRSGAHVLARGDAWACDPQDLPAGERCCEYRDSHGSLRLPMPDLFGAHQIDNYALAVAMLRHQAKVPVTGRALIDAARTAVWPGRMQRLGDGPLIRRLPGAQRRDGVWLDGAHNPQAAAAIAGRWCDDGATALVIGMLANKDADAVLRHLIAPRRPCTVVAIPVPGHAHHPPDELVAAALRHGAVTATAASSIEAAFDLLAKHGSGTSVMIAGSLYLAGAVLAANDEAPD